jgi:hypothetical protein
VKENKLSLLLAVCVALPIGFHYFLLTKYAVNIPYLDDFAAILEFLNSFSQTNLSGKIALMFSQHMEHRIVLSRLIFLFDYYILDGVNFKTIILLGNLGLVACLFAVYKLTPADKNKLFYFLPIPFFLVQSQHYETAYWAMAMSNFFIVAFAIFALVQLNKSTRTGFWMAIGFTVLAMFTSGNGIFVPFCGALLLILQRQFNSRLWMWLLFSALALVAFFYHYKFVRFDRSPLENLSLYPDQLLGAFLGAVGGALNFEKEHGTVAKGFGFAKSIILGIGLSLLLLEQIRTRLKNPLYFVLLLFFFLSLGAACMSRLQFGSEYMSVASRFKINSTMILIIFYFIYIQQVPLHWIRRVCYIFLVAAVAFNAMAFARDRVTIKAHQSALLRSSVMLYTRNSYDGMVHFDPPSVKPVLEKSKALGIYTMPDASPSHDNVEKSRPVSMDLPAPSDSIDYGFEILAESASNYYSIKDGWAFVKQKDSKESRIYIVLQAPKKTYVFQTRLEKRADQTMTSQDKLNHPEAGFEFNILKADIESLLYKVGILIVRANGVSTFTITDQVIDNTKERDSNLARAVVIPPLTNDIQFACPVTKLPTKFKIFQGWAIVTGEVSTGCKIYLVLKSAEDALVFETFQEERLDVSAHFRRQENDESLNYDDSGFNFLISRDKLKPTIYTLGIIIETTDGKRHFQMIERVFDNSDLQKQ